MEDVTLRGENKGGNIIGLLAVGTMVLAGGKDLREAIVTEIRNSRAETETEEKEVLKAAGK